MRQKYEFKSIVAETLLIPLYMRAKESSQHSRIRIHIHHRIKRMAYMS